MFKKLTPLTGILLVVLIGLMLYGLIDSGLLSTGDTGVDKLLGLNKKNAESKPISARDASKYRSAAPLQNLAWKSGWESDPFYYAEAETTDALGGGILGSLFGNLDGGDRPNLELSMISWNGNVGMALVNGDILEEGDRVAGYQITKIAFDHIILRKGTSIVKVNLND